MDKRTILFVRFLIVVKIAVVLWFALTPESLPEEIKAPEMMLNSEWYSSLGHIIVYLIFLECVLCLSLWCPTRLASWAYLAIAVLIAGLRYFGNAFCLSAIDDLIIYLGDLASGAMLGILWVYGYFSMSSPDIRKE